MTNVFKVGDRVRGIADYEGKAITGQLGKVLTVNDSGSVCVEFDNDIGGHTGRGDGKDGHCWNTAVSCLELSDGKKRTVQYILQYMRDEDPFEVFYDLETAKQRIAKLVETDRYVKRESFVLYHVDQIQKVKIDMLVSFVNEEGPARRGRPRKNQQ